MASILNADNGVVSGSSGLKMSSDTSGILNLQTNGTTAISISASQVVSFGATSSIDFSGAVSLSGGTANGVAYLNGSKVVTTGSALTFDGTNLNLNSGTAVSATSGGSVTAGVFAARAPLSAHQTATGVFQYSANETTLRSYGATGVTGALVFNLGAGGSADAEYMRLNSTGLGIGTSSPGAKLHVVGAASSSSEILRVAASSGPFVGIGTEGTNYSWIQGYGSKPLYINPLGNDTVFNTGGGNLGLGVTPVSGASAGTLFLKDNAQFVFSGPNSYYYTNAAFSSGNNRYVANGYATSYVSVNGQHQWSVAPSGTAGNAISFTQAMTLDQFGRWMLGTTDNSYGIAAIKGDWISGKSQLALMSSTASGSAGIGFFNSAGSRSGYLSLDHATSTINFGTQVSGPLVFVTADTERARITSGGNLGIGNGITPSNTAGYSLQAQIEGSLPCITISNTGTNTGKYSLGVSNGAAGFWDNAASAYRWYVDSSGYFLVGTTTTNSRHAIYNGSAVNGVLQLRQTNATAGKYHVIGPSYAADPYFVIYDQAGTGVYLTNGGTSWNATSDERLKTDLVPITDAANKVSTLRAVTGRFKTDEEGKSRAFLIAQDVQAVLPEAVNDTPEGNLGLSYTDTIPLLVAAIKELTARVAQLESK